MDITIAEMIAALEAAALAPETAEGITARDLRRATGWNEKRIIRLLQALNDAGRLGVRKVYRLNLAGHYMPIPAYYLLAGKEKATGGSGGFDGGAVGG